LQADGLQPSLSEAVQAMPEPILAINVTGKLWIDVDDLNTFERAQALIN
jgi:hypothetical protein